MVYVVFWCVVNAGLGNATCQPQDPPTYSNIDGVIPGRGYRTPEACLDYLRKLGRKWGVQVQDGKLVSGESNHVPDEWYQCFPEPAGEYQAVLP